MYVCYRIPVWSQELNKIVASSSSLSSSSLSLPTNTIIASPSSSKNTTIASPSSSTIQKKQSQGTKKNQSQGIKKDVKKYDLQPTGEIIFGDDRNLSIVDQYYSAINRIENSSLNNCPLQNATLNTPQCVHIDIIRLLNKIVDDGM